MPRPLPAALLLLLACAVAAHAQSADQGRGERTLDPGQLLHPLPSSLRPGDGIVYDWAVLEPAGAELLFSTHIHIGPDLVNLTVETTRGAQGRLTADREGQYSLLWDNTGNDTVTFRYTYQAERAPAPKPAPAPAAALVLAGMGALALAARRR